MIWLIVPNWVNKIMYLSLSFIISSNRPIILNTFTSTRSLILLVSLQLAYIENGTIRVIINRQLIDN